MKITTHIGWLVVLGSTIAVCGQSTTPVPPADVAVVVNAANPTRGLSAADVRLMLLGERHFWRGNVQVKLVLRRTGTQERDPVVTRLLKMSDSDFGRMWRMKEFRGELAGMPEFRSSDAQVFQYVREHPGALAVIAARSVPADVKLLRIEGKLPGESGYPLK
jgi:hypothetical protein